jgi:Surfeit locus protein 6
MVRIFFLRAYHELISPFHFHRTERKEELTKSMAAKQKKRTDNIAMRNERKNDKRKGLIKSKNKARPGFEGKSFGKGKGKPSKGK